jgi:CheY-like chemotaxis protein
MALLLWGSGKNNFRLYRQSENTGSGRYFFWSGILLSFRFAISQGKHIRLHDCVYGNVTGFMKYRVNRREYVKACYTSHTPGKKEYQVSVPTDYAGVEFSMMSKKEETPKVLVVDDDAEMVYLAQYLLEQCGYQSDTAMDLQGFKKAYAESPAVVMLDLTMPNGASEEISDIMVQQHAKHPIIFVTGKSPEEIERRRKDAESRGLKIAAILHKPFWIEDIASAMTIAMTFGISEN